MGILRRKRDEIHDTAVQSRGRWSAAERFPSTVPIYESWVRNGGTPPGQENLCHYWRVIIFWAATRWVCARLEPFLLSRAGAATLGVLGALSMLFLVMAVGGVAAGSITFLLCYAVVGAMAAWFYLDEYTEPSMDRKLVYATAPVSYSVIGVVRGGQAFARWWKPGWWTAVYAIVLSLAALVAVALAIAAVVSFGWLACLEFVGGIVVGLVVLVGAGVGAQLLLDWRKRVRREKRDAWFAQATNEEIAAYYANATETGWLVRAWWTVRDMFGLVAEAIRAKKWGICPLIDVNETANER